MLIDARSVDDGSRFEFDLAVVGAGPAGISLVDRLRDSGLSIGLIEGGGFHPELRTQRLYQGDTVGHYASASQLLELSTPDFTVARWASHMPPPLPISDVDFENAIVQYSAPTNFGDKYGPRIASSPHVTTLIHANVTEALLDDAGDRIDELRVATLTARSFTIRARVVVLATGGMGVVDADCRVHSVKNLYIAGSSVFTTGGYANPTFTIVALALRLADHLQQVLRS
jgi:choline dehydrogenase-like flavoprotein